MILITGGTGFIGKNLVKHLALLGKPVRLLLPPATDYSRLPKGINLEVAIASLLDERGLKAAMRGVEGIFHLASGEHQSTRADFEQTDIPGTRNLVQVAQEAGIDRFFFLSHIGANRSSAYPVLKTKAINEFDIEHSSLPYTIVRSSVVFGPEDRFTTAYASLIRRTPFIFLLPDSGATMLQPLFVDDLVVCLVMMLEDTAYERQTVTLGGAEYIRFKEALQLIMQQIKVRKPMVSLAPAYLRALSVWYENSRRDFPISIYWLDYLAADRTTSIDVLPRLFGIMPARFANNISYLSRK